MGYGIKVKISGDYALFTRPDLKVERVSYEVITPSAARNIIQAIYWKPAIEWYIDKIHVLNEIRFENVRRNEVEKKISYSNVKKTIKENGTLAPIYTDEVRQQRTSMVLKDVSYIIEAHFELTEKAGEDDTKEKHYNMALRRLRQGQCFMQPYFGCREFSANFEEAVNDEASFYKNEVIDLGVMLYDIDFKNNMKPVFYNPVMKNGVINVSESKVIR